MCAILMASPDVGVSVAWRGVATKTTPPNHMAPQHRGSMHTAGLTAAPRSQANWKRWRNLHQGLIN